MFQTTFEYRVGFLDPVDWRPREYDIAADHVANCILESQCDVDTLGNANISRHLMDAVALQVFCDGGFSGRVGAGAIIVTSVKQNGEAFESAMIGAKGKLILGAKSAFHAEVTALDIAIEFLLNLSKKLAYD